jgi:hypothetical protein
LIDTPEARRNLRYNLETYNVENGKKFLEEMKVIKNHLESTETLSNELNQMCSSLKLKVDQADSNMKNFIEKTSTLEKNKNLVINSKNQIEFFLSKYHMNESDVRFLQTANLDLPSEFSLFFQKLHKLQESFVECQKFAESNNNFENKSTTSSTSSSTDAKNNNNMFNTGLIHFELLEVLGNQKENAYLYLFQWIKGKCELLSDFNQSTTTSSANANAASNLMKLLMEDSDLIHKLQIAIANIKDIPIYFQQCQDLLIPAKRNILINKFMIALTQGEVIADGSTPHHHHHHSSSSSSSSSHHKTALDLQSHDPMLYVSSILAWLHQTIAQEREYLEAIFNDAFYNQSVNSPSTTSSSANSRRNTSNANPTGQTNTSSKLNEYNQMELLARIISSLGKPLRIRIIQTLENHNSLDILYGLADLLLFYEKIFRKLIPNTENAIHSCLKGCFNECKNLFRMTLKKQIDYLLNSSSHSILLPNYPLQSNSPHSNVTTTGTTTTTTGTNMNSYLDLKVALLTREYSKIITNILRICCNSLSNLPFESTPEASDGLASSNKENPATSNVFHMDVVLGEIIQPLLQYCRVQVSKLASTEMAIYMLNNIGFLQVNDILQKNDQFF